MSVNKFLKQLTTGDSIKDFTHASRTFVDDSYALQPRHKHLFHVVFNLADGVGTKLQNPDFKRTIHLLVKSTDLPQFEIEVDDKNQYNRHRYTQHKMNYQPINMTFHDDQSDIVRHLWQDYYRFYYQDGQFNEGGLKAPTYTTDDVYTSRLDKNIEWGMDRGPLNPNGKQFFTDIRIYSMYQKKYVEHLLVNPIISAFGHDRHDYADGALMEHRMTLQYETVLYNSGYVVDDNPSQFAVHHYDKTLSPLTPFGGGTNSIFGNGGLFDGANSVLNEFGKGNVLGGLFGAARVIQNGKGINIKRVLKDELIQNGKNYLRNQPLNISTIFPQVPKSLSLPNVITTAKTTVNTTSSNITSQGVNLFKNASGADQ